jgi:FtsP/CotA-like multicopper oxidase with cupredoxin domain
MNPEFRKVALAAAVLGLVVALFVALRPNDDEGPAATTTAAATTTEAATTEATPTEPATTATTSAPTTIAIVVEGGRPVGGIQRVSVTKGEKAVLVVSSDVADEIHFHGYDLSADVEAGGSAEIPFTATIVGRFEVELEDRGVQLAEIEVQP